VAEINLLAEDERQRMAQRLRYVADNIETGRVTVHHYKLDAEWIPALPNKHGQTNTRPTGLTHLNLSFWTTPIESLAE
jgi:hypothetical protein